MQQALNFLPDPHGQGSLRPTFFPRLRTGSRFFSVDRWLPAMAASCCWRTPPRGRHWGELRLGLVVDRLGAVELPLRAEVVEELGVELFDAEDQVGDAVADAVPHLGEDPHALPACTRPWDRSGRSLAGRSSCGGGPWRGGVPSSSSRGSGAGRPFPSRASRAAAWRRGRSSSVRRISAARHGLELVGADLEPEDSLGPRRPDRPGPRDRAAIRSCSGCGPAEPGGRELGFELFGQLARPGSV